jgi:pimeloyl-ACP methyl ester carboxylesterase
MVHNQQTLALGEGIRAFTAGSGTTVVLLPGWPETAEAYNEVVPPLAARHRVLAVDLPGLGESAPPAQGFDTGGISGLLEDSIKGAAPEPFHLVGHDVGAWIAYAWAAQFPERIVSLTLLDSALPGLAPAQSYPLPFELNLKLWQFSFNTLPDLPEVLTRGRERELFEWLFQHKAQHPERLSQASRERYVECYARPGGMSNGFAYYRAAATSALQNIEFSKTKLQMPVLALGGKTGVGDRLRQSMKSLAVHVEGGEIEDCGHYVMEEQPEFVSRELLRFFDKVDGAGS